MPKAGRRFDLRAAVVAGVAAGLSLAAFEMVATSRSGAGPPGMPLRMAAAMVLGRRALAADYPFAAAGIMGMAIDIVLSVAFAGVFAAIVSWVSHFTEGELLTTSWQVLLAGIFFGVVLWLVNFYVVAPLAGWTWFTEDVHHTITFLGHVAFGGVLGVALGRHRMMVLRGA